MSSDDAAPAVEMTLLQELRDELYGVLPNRVWCEYWRRLDLAHDVVTATCGVLITAPCVFTAKPPRFDFARTDDESAVMSAVIEALDSDGETVADLIAWPLDRPTAFATALGVADVLGISAITNPTTYFANMPLRVWRTPERWLREGCSGCVVLNRATAASTVGEAMGFVAGEDAEHARELARWLRPYFDVRRILTPVAIGRAA